MLAALLLLAAAAAPHAAETLCPNADACRHVDTIRVQLPDGRDAPVPVDQDLPWIIDDHLLLIPGDWAIVRLADRDGKLVPQVVKAGQGDAAPEPAEGEIRVKVHAFDAGNLVMEVLSRRTETLDYAALVDVGRSGPQRTSICSLTHGVTVYESWRWPIRQLALGMFRPTTVPGCKEIESATSPSQPAKAG